ncbi:uncharacterized protein LOC122380898 [Amphibalanus amphitrite]|uniref:uncharacterized protein LOC122380898 n=1 Tax=Amphibalanus amphitrite TaxID=1232801 RepID=UPI001C900E97|nr:uncharacterized protein LOC122380898 [Amphibalanus amphitrite]
MSDSDTSVSGYDQTVGEWVVARKTKRSRISKAKIVASTITDAEETVPKSIFCPISPLTNQPTAAPEQLTSATNSTHTGENDDKASHDRVATSARAPTLDQLIPTSATSADKKRLIAESDCIFSGRYDPAAVCCIMASMDEPDLRELRELLHAALSAVIPAVAGRPLCRRVTGNLAGLADDCWTLGYSAAQGMLTQRANAATLKPAGRNPLPPPGPTRSPPSDSAMSCPSAITSSLEAIISTQLRMENEIRELHARQATQDAYKTRLKQLELEITGLRRECAARDDTIDQLKVLVEGLLAREGPQPRRPVTPGLQVQPGRHDSDARSAANDATAVTEEAHSDRTAAREIAANLDLRALGEAIAGALHWRVGDSDSEPEQQNTHTVSERRTAQPANHSQAAVPTAAPTSDTSAAAPGGPTRRQSMVTGSGPPSALIQEPPRQESRKEKFILEGFRVDVADSDVRSLVWTVVRNLHDFQRVSRRGPAASVSKAFKIEVDAEDTDRILDPSSWPTGLVVRLLPHPVNTGRRGQRFRRPAASSGRSQTTRSAAKRTEHGNANWQATAPRRYSDVVRGIEHCDTAWTAAAQRRDEDETRREAVTSQRSRAPNRDCTHGVGTSSAVDAVGGDGSNATHGDGGWEEERPRRYGPFVPARYHGHQDDNAWVSTYQRRDGDGHWATAASHRPGAPSRGSEQDAGAPWVPAASRHVRGGATHGGNGWRATASQCDGSGYRGWPYQRAREATSWE